MKFKKDFNKDALKVDCDFWYDLTDGGYINPFEFLEDNMAKKVETSIAIVRQFQEAYEEACNNLEEFDE